MRFSLKYLVCFTIILIIYWIITSLFKEDCSLQDSTDSTNGISVIELNRKSESNIYFSPELKSNGNSNNNNKKRTFFYNRYLPLVFVSGVPGSGLSLMCNLLDEDVNIRCSDNYGLVSEMLFRTNEWTSSKIEKERLMHASMTDTVIDGAVIAFILDLMLKQGKLAPRICNKDNRILNHAVYMKKLFPNVKFLFMIRDPRAAANTIVNKRLLINGAKLNNHKDALVAWNKIIEKMYTNCAEVGFDTCMPIYYEKLLMEPEKTLQQVYKFIKFNRTVALSADNAKFIQIDKNKLAAWHGKFPGDLNSQLSDLASYFSKLGYVASSNTNYSYLFKHNIFK